MPDYREGETVEVRGWYAGRWPLRLASTFATFQWCTRTGSVVVDREGYERSVPQGMVRRPADRS